MIAFNKQAKYSRPTPLRIGPNNIKKAYSLFIEKLMVFNILNTRIHIIMIENKLIKKEVVDL